MPSTPRSWNRGALTFLATCALCLTFVLLSHYSNPSSTPPIRRDASSLLTRDVEVPSTALSDDEKCRLVHKAADQCSFIHENCPQDEGGFSAYLDLYFCSLSHAKPVALSILILWLALLFSTIGVAASDFFCVDLGTLAQILGMSENLTGVTFLAFGNGSPDVFSTFAAMSTNSGSLAVGELFGAAGFIAAVVAGSMALIRPFHVARKSFVRDVGFFAAAAAFSMVFLLDGRLHFWECIVMVVFYVFYVIFVVCWHMWLGRRRRRREREAAARGHFVHPEDETELENEEYHDDPEEAADGGRPSASRALSREDWSALERGGGPDDNNEYEDDEEEARDKWMSEFNSNMRLTRPTARARRNTTTPIRPSLMGALEFQAVLKSLQKSRNMQTIPMDSRQFLDDPTHTMISHDQMSTSSDPSMRPSFEITDADENSPLVPRTSDVLALPSAPVGRARAVSANDASALRLAPPFRTLSPVQSEPDLMDFRQAEDAIDSQSHSGRSSPRPEAQRPSPAVLIEPATPRRETPIEQMRGRAFSNTSGDLLAPPDAVPVNRPHSEYFASPSPTQADSPRNTPRLVPRAGGLPRIVIPRDGRSPASSRSTSPFPAYRDRQSPSLTAGSRSPSTRPPSLYLPSPLASPESIPVDQTAEREVPRRPTKLSKIWPSSILPPPGNIISTLFPAFYHWSEKSWLERLIGIYAAPSVFFLTITLPVVERDEREKQQSTTSAKSISWHSAQARNSVFVSPKTPDDSAWPDSAHPHSNILNGVGVNGGANTVAVAANTEQHRGNIGRNTPQISISAEPEAIATTDPDESSEHTPELWNRWLTIIQLFLAPIFIVLAIYIQADDVEPKWLVRPILICLLVSLVLLIPLLLTTTPTYRPSCYCWILSGIGFVVAIAWISAIASQVVGALKALAVILNMSHAIMGLTIFAVGNSLGDLVADVTVAKIGYPVMALSACFAGPMMNILLGIGLSGSYRLIRGEEKRRRKHPEKGIRFRTYHIEVSKTLIVSGITLLITLVGLLIFVPLNKWVMDRKIGVGLIALWTISTIFNVVVEVTGFLDEFEAFVGPFLGQG